MEQIKDLLDLGVKFFPVAANSKHPTNRGWKTQASNDVELISSWLAQGLNIGILCGKISENKYLVGVDIDDKVSDAGVERRGFESVEMLDLVYGKQLPPTWSQLTPNGGRHMLYISPVPIINSSDIVGIGIDTKCQGGLFVGPGSQIDGRFYTPEENNPPLANAPNWLVEDMLWTEPVLAKVETKRNVDFKMARRRGEDYLSKLEPAHYGQRNHAGFKAACKLKDFGLPPEMVLEVMEAHWQCDECLEQEEIIQIVNSAFSYGQNDPASDAPENVFDPIAPEPKRKLRMKFDGEFSFESAAEPLIDGLINKKEVSSWVGAPNAGKSAMLAYSAVCIASGSPMFGRETERGAVLYCALESPAGIEMRMLANKKQMGLENESLPIAVLEETLNFTSKPQTDLVIQAAQELEEATGHRCKLIVIDTLSRLIAGADESSSQYISAVVAELDKIKNATGAHIAIVHHTGKNEEKGARGSSALLGAVDTEIIIKPGAVVVTKQREMEHIKPITFKLAVHVLGTRKNGKVVSSVAIEPLTGHASEQAFAPKAVSARSKAGQALTILKSLLESDGQDAHPSLGLVAGTKVVARLDWALEVSEKLYEESDDVNQNTKAKAFSRALKALIQSGHIMSVGDYVWLVGLRSVVPEAQPPCEISADTIF